MISVNRRNATVVAWAHARPDDVSKRFHNMLMRDPLWYDKLLKLHWLFAEDGPWGRGRYRHHDGARS